MTREKNSRQWMQGPNIDAWAERVFRLKVAIVQKCLLWLYIFSTGLFVVSLEPGYLDFDNLPDTNFSCVGKVIGGYYADLETNCQMFHVCTIGQLEEPMDIRFLCLNGTVFDQETRVCERIDEVDCSKSEKFYSLNLELYGNTQPPALEENPETEVPIIEKTTPSTTTTTTTTPRPTTTTTPKPPQYFTSSIRPITPSPYHKGPSSHHFSIEEEEDEQPEYSPEEINISLNPGAPPNVRTKPFEYPRHPYSDNINSNNKKIIVTTHSSVYKSDNNVNKQSVNVRPYVPLVTTESDINYNKNVHTPRPPQNNFNYHFNLQNDNSQNFNDPSPHNYRYQSNIANFRPPGLSGHSYSNNPFRSSTNKNEYLPITRKNFDINRPTSTARSFFLQPIKSPSHQYFTRTEKPQGEQLPVPVLPTLPPIVFSSPSPFTLSRRIETKRFTDEHELPPRIIISASASVSDASGRTLNYSLGTIGAAQILAQPPSSYDEYKDDDVVLDPFYHDVPKVQNKKKRSKRDVDTGNESNIGQSNLNGETQITGELTRSKRVPQALNPSDIIRSEDEAIEVLKFLFDWYKSHEKTTKSTTLSIPVSPDVITNINNEFSPKPYISDDYIDYQLQPQERNDQNDEQSAKEKFNYHQANNKDIASNKDILETKQPPFIANFQPPNKQQTEPQRLAYEVHTSTRSTITNRKKAYRGRHRFTSPLSTTESYPQNVGESYYNRRKDNSLRHQLLYEAVEGNYKNPVVIQKPPQNNEYEDILLHQEKLNDDRISYNNPSSTFDIQSTKTPEEVHQHQGITVNRLTHDVDSYPEHEKQENNNQTSHNNTNDQLPSQLIQKIHNNQDLSEKIPAFNVDSNPSNEQKSIHSKISFNASSITDDPSEIPEEDYKYPGIMENRLSFDLGSDPLNEPFNNKVSYNISSSTDEYLTAKQPQEANKQKEIANNLGYYVQNRTDNNSSSSYNLQSESPLEVYQYQGSTEKEQQSINNKILYNISSATDEYLSSEGPQEVHEDKSVTESRFNLEENPMNEQKSSHKRISDNISSSTNKYLTSTPQESYKFQGTTSSPNQKIVEDRISFNVPITTSYYKPSNQFQKTYDHQDVTRNIVDNVDLIDTITTIETPSSQTYVSSTKQTDDTSGPQDNVTEQTTPFTSFITTNKNQNPLYTERPIKDITKSSGTVKSIKSNTQNSDYSYDTDLELNRQESQKTTNQVQNQISTETYGSFDIYDYVNDNYEPITYTDRSEGYHDLQLEKIENSKRPVHEETYINIDITEIPPYTVPAKNNNIDLTTETASQNEKYNTEPDSPQETSSKTVNVSTTSKYKYIDKNINSFSDILKSLRDFQRYEQNIYDYNHNLTEIKDSANRNDEDKPELKEESTTSTPMIYESFSQTNLSNFDVEKIHHEDKGEPTIIESTTSSKINHEISEKLKNSISTTLPPEGHHLYTSKPFNYFADPNTITTINSDETAKTTPPRYIPFGTEYTETTSTTILDTTTSYPIETLPAETTLKNKERIQYSTETISSQEVTPRVRTRGRNRNLQKSRDFTRQRTDDSSDVSYHSVYSKESTGRRRNSRRRPQNKFENIHVVPDNQTATSTSSTQFDNTPETSKLDITHIDSPNNILDAYNTTQELNTTYIHDIPVQNVTENIDQTERFTESEIATISSAKGFFITKFPPTGNIHLVDSLPKNEEQQQTTPLTFTFNQSTEQEEVTITESLSTKFDDVSTISTPPTTDFLNEATETEHSDKYRNTQQYAPTFEIIKSTTEVFSTTEQTTTPSKENWSDLLNISVLGADIEVEKLVTNFETATSTLSTVADTEEQPASTNVPTTSNYNKINDFIKVSSQETTETTTQDSEEMKKIIKEIEENTHSVVVSKTEEEIVSRITTVLPSTKTEIVTKINISEENGTPIRRRKPKKEKYIPSLGVDTSETEQYVENELGKDRNLNDFSNRVGGYYTSRRAQQKLPKKSPGYRRFSSRHRFSSLNVTPKTEDNRYPLRNSNSRHSQKEATRILEDEELPTDAPLPKNVKPTQGDPTRNIHSSTTPLSNLYKVQLRKEKVNKQFIFNCFGKALNTFYSDPRDCRLFHYCTVGYTKNQLLDMKFVCDLGTHFDDEKLVCTREIPKRCV
ncbi:hypothetical protein HHI36_006943 [Cryptolaemus montrouzieri]|uniref:Chitin-binding type-2 domain-containing protein n=1 Tax=Cryptolaemus montrouzieri TaxID=559131 RepID=A0ABD2MN26_9CUCU